MSEFAFINWIRKQTAPGDKVLVGPGDDAAAFEWDKSTPCIISTDMLLEGSCFVLKEAGPHRVGRKAIAVNLSDMAAMAAKPFGALVSVGLPRTGGSQLAEELYLGMREMLDSFDTVLLGGDTSSWAGPLVLSVTILGEASGSGPILRKGARPGDWLMVTGSLGGSILGRHLDFVPRVQEAILLNQEYEIHAMIDISDGLAADVWHLCEESGCGAILHAEEIPIHPIVAQLMDGRAPLAHALEDGEDFELALAVSPETGQQLVQNQPLNGVPISRIGMFLEDGYWLRDHDQQVRPLEGKGYIHEL